MAAEQFGLFLFCGSIFMAVCVVTSEDLPNETFERQESKKIKGEYLKPGKPFIETEQVRLWRKVPLNHVTPKKSHTKNVLDNFDRENDVIRIRTNHVKGSFHHYRPRREVHYVPSESKDKASINSNTGYNECYLCPAGPSGGLGPPGTPGRDGGDGSPGERGLPGPIGTTGPSGPPGRDGRDGVLGSCGDQSVRTPSSTNSTIPGSGVTFTRWGRVSCPSTSQLVYSGISVGSFYSTKGGTAEVLCLPDTPQYSFTMSGNQDVRSPLVNVEYHSKAFPPLDAVQDHEMPCSVCMAPGRITKLMVPGRKTCPSSDWTLEYSGYLQSAKKNAFRTVTICLDESPDTLGTDQNTNGVVLVNVEYRCNENCGEYTGGLELTCAVCTI